MSGGFITVGEHRCLGRHVLLDVFKARPSVLDDQAALARAMRKGAELAGATILFEHFHPFEGGGLTGVLLLAESHITIHTWPEHGYAAVDVFMCGDADPLKAARVIGMELAGERSRFTVTTELRGVAA